MIGYIKFLLDEFNDMPAAMVNARSLFIKGNSSADAIINLILDTELKSYIVGIAGHKLEKVSGVGEDIDILELDGSLKTVSSLVPLSGLRNIMRGHYNPVWRVAAFFCGYLINANRFYNAKNNN